MLFKSLSLTLFGLVFSTASIAKDYQVKSPTLFRYDFSSRVPQTFVLDKNGDVVYHQFKASNNVRKAINRTEKLNNSEHHISQFEKILGEPISYNDSGYTLVEVVWDKSSYPQNCDPCDKQMKINGGFIKAVEKKDISIERHTIHVEFVESFIKDW